MRAEASCDACAVFEACHSMTLLCHALSLKALSQQSLKAGSVGWLQQHTMQLAEQGGDSG
jgi:hypothetical protein